MQLNEHETETGFAPMENKSKSRAPALVANISFFIDWLKLFQISRTYLHFSYSSVWKGDSLIIRDYMEGAGRMGTPSMRYFCNAQSVI